MSQFDITKLPKGPKGFMSDWASDQKAFKGVPWGKAMMWIFLLSDTFIFSCFLISLMTARASTTVPWPYASKVFGLTVFALLFVIIYQPQNYTKTSYYLYGR